MEVQVTVDRRSPVGLASQICDDIRRGILEGRLRPGDRMPSTRELAVSIRVARATVTTAFDQLVAEGYLEGVRGSGTYVCRELPRAEPWRGRRTAPPDAGARLRLSSFAARLGPIAKRPASHDGVLDLSSTHFDTTLFPFGVWNRLVRRQLRRQAAASRRAVPDSGGHPRLRESVAAYLQRARAVRCTPDQVLIVNGSQQALDLCARILVDAGDHVAVEEPGYPEARRLFEANGAVVHPVPVDREGVVVSALPPHVRLAHVTPSHQYPTGVALSLSRRLELLEWARNTGGVILEDDYDSEFRYEGAPLPSLQGLGDSTRVVYAGTFSLATFPGLRLGYLVLPPSLVEVFQWTKWHADRHTAQLEQAALADFVREGHMERHIRRLRRVYKRRHAALEEALQRHFGDRAAIAGGAAGLHAVVRFTPTDIAARAERAGVALQSTRICYAGPTRPREFIVRFANLPERTIREAIRRLAAQR